MSKPKYVWIVTEDFGQDESIEIREVFGTPGLAERYKRSQGARRQYQFDIEKHKVKFRAVLRREGKK